MYYETDLSQSCLETYLQNYHLGGRTSGRMTNGKPCGPPFQMLFSKKRGTPIKCTWDSCYKLHKFTGHRACPPFSTNSTHSRKQNIVAIKRHTKEHQKKPWKFPQQGKRSSRTTFKIWPVKRARLNSYSFF